MKNSIKIIRIIFIVLIIASIISICKFGIDIYIMQKLDVKEEKKYEAIVNIDETEKIMRFKFISVDNNY